MLSMPLYAVLYMFWPRVVVILRSSLFVMIPAGNGNLFFPRFLNNHIDEGL